jgi:TP901 family phage tail tape measure protein
MAEKIDVSGRIAIEDAASPVIKKVEGSIASVNRMAAKMGQGFTKAGSAFKAFGQTGAFGGITKNIRATTTAVGTLGKSFLRVGSQIALLAGAAGFGGLAYEMNSYIENTDKLNKTAARFGIPIEQLQSLRTVAKLSNIEVEDLDKSMGLLTKNMVKAAQGGKKNDVAGLFAKLGISVKDAKGQMRSAADVLPALANAFEKNTNATLRTQMATTLFGKSGAKMIDMLVQGGASFREAMEAAKAYGQITQEQADLASKASDAQVNFGKAIEGVKNTIMAGLLPSLLPVVDAMTKWIAANRQWLATGIEKFIFDLSAAIKTIDWDRLWQGAEKVGAVLKTVSDAIGGINTIIPLFAAVLGASMLSPLFAVTLALGKLAVALGTALVGPLTAVIASLGSLAVGLGTALLGALTGATSGFAAFSAVLAANPIGVVVVALAALGAAAYAIYDNWEPIAAFFSAMWSNVEAAFISVGAWFDRFVAQFVPGGLVAAWQSVAGFFSDTWAGVQTVFETSLSWLDGVLRAFVPVALTTAWEGLAATFSGIWRAVQAVFDLYVAALGVVVSLFIPADLEAAWTGLGAAFERVWSGVSAVFTGAVAGIQAILRSLVPDILIDIWTTTLPQAMAAPWQAVSEVFSSYVASIQRIAAMLVPQPILDAWGGLAGFFARMWDAITGAFERAWAAIKPIIDAIMAAIGPVIEAAGKVAAIGGGVVSAAKGSAQAVGRGAESAVSTVKDTARNAWGWLTGSKGQPNAAGPLQQGNSTMPQQTARLEGEVETKIRVDLAPGLVGSAETSDSGSVRSSVNVGQTMVPA